MFPRPIALLLALLALAAPPASSSPAAPPRVLAEGAVAEKIAAGFGHAEGPLWMPEGFLIFCDTTANRLLRFDDARGLTIFREPCGRATGLGLDPQGRLVAAESHGENAGRRISRREADGTWRPLAERFEGRRFNSPNDLTIDARGRIYFTDPRYSRPETMELTHESIYRLDPSGALARLGSPLRRPNGIVLMRDGRTLIVGDNASTENVAALWAFDVASDGSLSQARKIHDFGGGRGPDGMTLDRDGRVWVTAGTGAKAGVYVFQLDAPRTAATPLAFLPLPDQPTNCTFGGAERDVLYITTDSALFRVRTLVSGAPTPPGK